MLRIFALVTCFTYRVVYVTPVGYGPLPLAGALVRERRRASGLLFFGIPLFCILLFASDADRKILLW